MDFSTIGRSGVTQEQFAALVGVSRVTVNTWVAGKFRPRNPVRSRVGRAIKMLNDAVETGLLPVPTDNRRLAVNVVLDSIYKTLNAPEA